MANIGRVVWASPDRHIETHKMLDSIPYLRTRKLITIDSPFPDLEKKCTDMHDAFWISEYRPDKIQPIYD